MSYETDERVAELTDRLENGVRELYASDSYAQYISAMAKFHHYSFGNALLILFQCPGASQVAGYNTWKQLGRQVKRGEKGIQILAPCSFRATLEREKIDPQSGQTLYGPDGKPLTEKVKIAPNRFKIAHVCRRGLAHFATCPRLQSARYPDEPRLGHQRDLQRVGQGFAPLTGPAQDTQAGFPGQIVFFRR